MIWSNGQAMNRELRRTGRKSVQTRSVLPGSGVVRGAIVDVSAGGVGLLSESSIAVGKQLHLAFEVDGGPISLVGEVRWTRRHAGNAFESGVKVMRIDVESQQRLVQLTQQSEAHPDLAA